MTDGLGGDTEGTREGGDGESDHDGNVRGDETTDDGGGPDESKTDGEVTEKDAPDWMQKYWLESTIARRLVWFDIALTFVLAIVVIALFHRRLPDVLSWRSLLESVRGFVADVAGGAGPGGSDFDVAAESVFVFALLGALGYVFTVLFKDVHRSAGKILEINFRVVGAIPVAAGTFLLSSYILDGEGIGTLGLAFLAGLYVNLAYERLGAVADYLLPPESDDGESDGRNGENGADGPGGTASRGADSGDG